MEVELDHHDVHDVRMFLLDIRDKLRLEVFGFCVFQRFPRWSQVRGTMARAFLHAAQAPYTKD